MSNNSYAIPPTAKAVGFLPLFVVRDFFTDPAKTSFVAIIFADSVVQHAEKGYRVCVIFKSIGDCE